MQCALRRPRFIIASLVPLFLLACSSPPAATVSGDLQVWHNVTLTFDGPDTSEDATPNPFRDFRLNVTFANAATGASYVVPGYFAADGDAANTSASAGHAWRVHFSPDAPGDWTYLASFRTGPDIAMSLDPEEGTPVFTDGASGSFRVEPSDELRPRLPRQGPARLRRRALPAACRLR